MKRAKRILVIDDDTQIRELLSMALHDEGYAVATAQDGLAGLEQADALRPDLVILDFEMPRCGGLAFARRYRQGADAAPIILVTASSNLQERCELVEADGCVGKPFDLDDLLEVVYSHAHSHLAAA